MREIKFRVWHKISKKYIKCYEVGGYANTEGTIPLNDVFNMTGLVFEQYTGFKDCEGKEIYEGDKVIVICLHDGDEEGNWSQEEQKAIPNIITWDEKRGAWKFPIRFTYASYDFKVIGNTHEVGK